jgi:hypothetical protein
MASDRRNLFWTLAHIGLGFLCTFTPFALIVWFYFIFAANLGKSLNLLAEKKPTFFLMLFSYLISFEVLDRMAKTSPFIPYELGKYFLVLMGILGCSILGVRSQKGLWMAILVIPALFYDFSGQRNQYDIINNLLGPLAVGLGLAFADRFPISKIALNQILKFIFWACLASLIFTYVRTPDFGDIEFKLGANFATTAGHSSNQVSTILGLGMFLAFYSLLKRLNFSGSRIFDGIILIGFTFQGLLSFSRGGMMVGALAMLLLFFLPDVKKVSYGIKQRVKSQRSIFLGIVALISFYAVFEMANAITGGNLLLRYQGETQGTLLGTKEVTVDHYVTGRLSILEKDFALWIENPLTGVGLGISQYLRNPDGPKVAAHVELSRLFADHGVLGIIFSFLFFNLPRVNWNQNKNSIQRNILFILLILSVASTFHAAMRTFITPLFMILGSLKIKKNQ